MSSDYATFHQNRRCLLLHIVFVPAFAISFAYAAYAAMRGHFGEAALSLALVMISLVLQGIGHKHEVVPPKPFKGPLDFAMRVLLEQYYRFWAFLFSGDFVRAYRQEGAARDA